MLTSIVSAESLLAIANSLCAICYLDISETIYKTVYDSLVFVFHSLLLEQLKERSKGWLLPLSAFHFIFNCSCNHGYENLSAQLQVYIVYLSLCLSPLLSLRLSLSFMYTVI